VLTMSKTIGSILAVIALAVGAFTLAYVGGGLMRSDPVEPAGAALRAPQLAVGYARPVAMRTPTATPSPRPTATPKPKKHKKKKKKAKKKKPVTPITRVTPRVTPVPTRIATPVPTPVYRPPVQHQQSKPKPKPTPGIIIED